MAQITDIKKCFDTYLNTYSTGAGVRVSWEGVSFTPNEGETWIDPHLILTRPTQRELVGASTRTRQEGLLQLNLVTKAGTGMNAIYEQYDALEAVFGRGTALTYVNGDGETILVEIIRYYMESLNESESPYMFLPVFVEFRSDILVG